MNTLVYISLLTIVANAVGILSGFGTGTIMTPLLLLFLPYQETLLLMAIILWFHDIWKLLFFRKHINWNLFIYFGFPSIITTYIGARLVANRALVTLFPKLLGIFLIFYVFFLFLFPDFKVVQRRLFALLGGAVQGFFAGLFGIKGPVRTVFLVAYKLPQAEYLATIGAISLVTDATRLGTYLFNGMRLHGELLWGLLIFVPASYLGAKIAQLMVPYISERTLRLFVAIFLLAIGIRFLILP